MPPTAQRKAPATREYSQSPNHNIGIPIDNPINKGKNSISTIIDSIKLVTIQVLQRKIGNILNISVKNNQLIFNDHVFSRDSGGSTVKNIVSYLEDGKIIIIDRIIKIILLVVI